MKELLQKWRISWRRIFVQIWARTAANAHVCSPCSCPHAAWCMHWPKSSGRRYRILL